ncbi:hypothetical protein NC652_034602 [Populus alba x Populus x berolinensis]|nr:hypothetical protein NC652_034602 [Populus alba x Populus x berolinensis]
MLTDGQSLGIGDVESLKMFPAEIREQVDREEENYAATCFVISLWNVNDVVWHALDSEGRSRGILAMCNNIYFKTKTIEYGGQWVALFGLHIQTSFKCAVVGVYGAYSIASHGFLWPELKTLDASFSVLMLL